MDTTIRNIDEEAYRKLRVYAAHNDLSIGAALSQLVRRHGQIPSDARRRVSFFDLKPDGWGPGTENTSQEIDEIVYGPEAQDVHFER